MTYGRKRLFEIFSSTWKCIEVVGVSVRISHFLEVSYKYVMVARLKGILEQKQSSHASSSLEILKPHFSMQPITRGALNG